MGTKKKGIKYEIMEEEDWCFECKEGGLLLVCDYKDCLKAYHAQCVGDDKSLAKDPWFCRWHSCCECKESSKYLCFGCPEGLCERCFHNMHFAPIRGNKGFCINCLKIALLGEKGIDVDSDGERVDLEDLETTEGLFFDYWKNIIKKKEGLTLEDLQSADDQIKKDGKFKARYTSIRKLDVDEGFQVITSSDDEDHNCNDNDDSGDDFETMKPKLVQKRKSSMEQKLEMPHGQKQKGAIPKSKEDIDSWASESLLEFLTSIGVDTTERYEPINIASIIYTYVDENKLLDPEKPRSIVCDERLRCLLGKKVVHKSKLVDLLQLHFPEYLSSEEEEETRCIPKQKEKKATVSRKRQRSLVTDKTEKEEEPVRAPQSYFALIVAENLKLVYLKKSLIQKLLKDPETFESKVVGSFIRVRSNLGTGSRSYSFQLLPVTGINILRKEQYDSENLLQVATLKEPVPINFLSNDNFSEEECEDLKKKVKEGLIRRPTIVELEKKAITLHEDITNHWIRKELVTLQNRMDQANEKGWRREFYGCYERQRQLRTPGERLRLLRKVPKVIPDLADDEPTAEVGTKEDGTEKHILQKSKLFESMEPITQDASQEDERREEILGKSMFESPDICESHEEENGNSTGERISSMSDQIVELVEKKIVLEKEMNCTIPVAEENEHHRTVSHPEEKHNYSTEACFLEVMSQRSLHVPPHVDANILFESEYFQ